MHKDQGCSYPIATLMMVCEHGCGAEEMAFSAYEKHECSNNERSAGHAFEATNHASTAPPPHGAMLRGTTPYTTAAAVGGSVVSERPPPGHSATGEPALQDLDRSQIQDSATSDQEACCEEPDSGAKEKHQPWSPPPELIAKQAQSAEAWAAYDAACLEAEEDK